MRELSALGIADRSKMILLATVRASVLHAKAKVKRAGTTLPRLGMKLETERLELRSATLADAPNLLALFSSPEVLRYLPPRPPVTLEQAEQSVLRRMKMEAELGYAPFIIVTRDGDEFIGSGGLVQVQDSTDVEVVYHFALRVGQRICDGGCHGHPCVWL
jgi:RimJ/RimL family protein N-acetyltransferase